MLKTVLFASFLLSIFISCGPVTKKEGDQKNKTEKIDKVDRERCSFDMPVSLYLGKIDSSFDKQGYFRILSDNSENRMQLFVYDSDVDVDEELKGKIEALNSPDVFTAKSIDSLNQFGNYKGKGVVMTGIYEGGIIKGKIKIFCYSGEHKGFVIVRQIITASDTSPFDEVEKSFVLK